MASVEHGSIGLMKQEGHLPEHWRAQPSAIDLIVFRGEADWEAMTAAEKALEAVGYTVGPPQRNDPRGCVFSPQGSVHISKWRNLGRTEKAGMDVVVTSADCRQGPVVLELQDAATGQARSAFDRIKSGDYAGNVPLPLEEMAALDFVHWDRYVPGSHPLFVFGWIERDDDHEDFVILEATANGVGYSTSSAEHTERISKALGLDGTTHKPCRRVELDVPDLPNAIRLYATSLPAGPKGAMSSPAPIDLANEDRADV